MIRERHVVSSLFLDAKLLKICSLRNEYKVYFLFLQAYFWFTKNAVLRPKLYYEFTYLKK